jgi:hypothetical protein
MATDYFDTTTARNDLQFEETTTGQPPGTLEELRTFMDYYLNEFRRWVHLRSKAEWDFQTNQTKESSEARVNCRIFALN